MAKKRTAKKAAKAKTSTERVRAHRERRTSKVQVNVTLSRAAVTRLDKICRSGNQSRAAIIERLLNAATVPAAKPKPVAKKKKSVRGGECHLCFEWMPDKELDNLGRGEYRYQYAQCKDFGACFKRRHPRG